MARHFCNEICIHNDNPDQICDDGGNVYHVGRRCVTFRKRPTQENYRDLMRPSAGICHREKGSMRSGSKSLVK